MDHPGEVQAICWSSPLSSYYMDEVLMAELMVFLSLCGHMWTSRDKQHLLEMVYYFIALVKVMMALLLRSLHVLFPPCHKTRVANLDPDERLWRTFETTIFEPKMSVTTHFLASFSVISNST